MSDDHAQDVQQYINNVLDGSIVTGRLERLAVMRHEDDRIKSETDPSYPFRFDEQIALDAIDFSLCCNQFEGEWGGQPLILRREQKFIVWCLFGWRQKSDGMRRFRQAQIETGRKWGKSTMIAYLVCLLLYADTPEEPGAQIYCAATKLGQAMIVFDATRKMIEKSDELRDEAKIHIAKNDTKIELPEVDAKFRPLAQDKTPDGFNPHAIIKDEEHAYRKHMTEFVNTLSSGFGARRQPLTITITTYGTDESDIWLDSHGYAVKCLESVITGDVVNDAWFAYIAAIDRAQHTQCFRCKGANCPWCKGTGTLPIDDEFDESVWVKANPGIGITPKWERMREWALEAKDSPIKHAEFLQKSVNVISSAKTRVITPEIWTESKGVLSDLISVTGHAGFDLGRSNDFSAIAAVFPFREVDDDGSPFIRYEAISKTWTVDNRVDDLKLPTIDRWIAQGHMVASPGEAVDFMDVEDSILEWHKLYSIRTWAYDKTYAPQMAQRIEAEGLEPFSFTQSHKFYTAPLKELLDRLLGQTRRVNGVDVPLFKHDGNPCLGWQAGNLIVERNSRGEMMPDKSKTANKIDAMVALLMALSECLYHAEDSLDGYYLRNPVALGGSIQPKNRLFRDCDCCGNRLPINYRRCNGCGAILPELEKQAT